MAIASTLIEPVKPNKIEPHGWLTWVLAQIAYYKITRLDELIRLRTFTFYASLVIRRGSASFNSLVTRPSSVTALP